MKFNRKSHSDLTNRIKQRKSLKKKFIFSFLKYFSWYKTIKLPLKKSSISPRIEQLENEFMCMLEKINEKNYQRLLITRSIDDFGRILRKKSLHLSLSFPFIHRSILKNVARRTNQSNLSLTNHRTIERNEISSKTIFSSIKSNISIDYQLHNAAIIDFEYQSLEKSLSSPLPINRNHHYSSISNNHLESAHLINSYFNENHNAVSLHSCLSEIGMNYSIDETISSDEEIVKHNLLKHEKDYHLQYRWSLMNIWDSTKIKLPSIFNHICQKRLEQTGSKEYLLECDKTFSTNNNYRRNSIEEQRYVEQERSIHAHIGLALFALLVFPPIGMISFILSVWSLCGQQDRNLSRKFGNVVYWISLLAISLAFFLLFTLLLYFTYRYLTHPLTSVY